MGQDDMVDGCIGDVVDCGVKCFVFGVGVVCVDYCYVVVDYKGQIGDVFLILWGNLCDCVLMQINIICDFLYVQCWEVSGWYVGDGFICQVGMVCQLVLCDGVCVLFVLLLLCGVFGGQKLWGVGVGVGYQIGGKDQMEYVVFFIFFGVGVKINMFVFFLLQWFWYKIFGGLIGWVMCLVLICLYLWLFEEERLFMVWIKFVLKEIFCGMEINMYVLVDDELVLF